MVIYLYTMTELQKYVKEYLDYLEIEKNRSVRTKENYAHYLNAFLEFTKIAKAKQITPEKVRDFRIHLARLAVGSEKKNLKKITQTYYIIALRNLLKYLEKQGIGTISSQHLELPKIPMRQIKIIDYRDLERLLSAPEGGDLRTLRDKAILEMLFSTGLRLSELCALNRHLNIDTGEISVRGKGGKLRVVFVSPATQNALKNYLTKRTDPYDAMFVSLAKAKTLKVLGRIIPRAVQRMVSYYTRKAGIQERVTPHMLRHLFATDLLSNGADLRSVQELLGHNNISTTQIYTHVTNRELREIHKAFHGKRR